MVALRDSLNPPDWGIPVGEQELSQAEEAARTLGVAEVMTPPH
jgi:hypothetical protein